ncbi:MAG: NAD(P)-binding protein [Pirellula sp.]|nr:NAD(P)-binding protein [Pirellula sp.]
MLEKLDNFGDVIRLLPPHLHERVRFFPAGQKGIQNAEESGEKKETLGPVVYWTHHALRTDENAGFDVACQIAKALGTSLVVYQGLSENYRFASDRHHTFALQGAQDLAKQYEDIGVRYVFHLDRNGYRVPALRLMSDLASVLVTDDFPGEPTQLWVDRLSRVTNTPILAVDSSCVVPMKLVGRAYDRAFEYRDATSKMYTERVAREWPKIGDLPPRYEGAIPFESLSLTGRSVHDLLPLCDIDHSIGPVADTIGGSKNGYARWEEFKRTKLSGYAHRRNDPTKDGVSRMSAYLHYGMVSPMRLARDAQHASAEKYLDELLIWRELAYCFCFYRDDYDSIEAVPDWARQSLSKHESDAREWLCTWEDQARARSGDEFWDTCQRSLLRHGELHNNVRMTWGKSLLKWTKTSSEALRTLIDLNHRYALDGRDPASYGGILWCLGQFDRPFEPEQPVYGVVRARSTDEHRQRMDFEKYQKLIDRPAYPISPRIAVIGAGMAGLMCSRVLVDHGLNVQLIDKSNGVSGRVATRTLEKALRFDHGAQYFTCRDPRVAKFVESWLQRGIVKPWFGKIVDLHEGGRQEDRKGGQRLVGCPSMNAIGKHLAESLAIRTASKVTRVVRRDKTYDIFAECKDTYEQEVLIGSYDCVLWNCPAPQLVAMVPKDCSWVDEIQRVRMKPCWASIVAFSNRWDVPFDGAVVHDETIRWIARDSSKPDRPRELDCWVLQSNHGWAKNHLSQSKEEIVALMLAQLERLTGVAPPEPLYRNSHRWLYADVEIPVASDGLSPECSWDSNKLLGACGDWYRHKNIEGAMLSGMALAGRVLGTLASPTDSLRGFVEDRALVTKPGQLTLF